VSRTGTCRRSNEGRARRQPPAGHRETHLASTKPVSDAARPTSQEARHGLAKCCGGDCARAVLLSVFDGADSVTPGGGTNDDTDGVASALHGSTHLSGRNNGPHVARR
jgi:hypothetical protein